MTNKIKIIVVMICLIGGQFAYGQSDKEKAVKKGQEAIALMDNGKIEESIKLLKEAQKLDPDNFNYPYEMAYAHYINADYKGAAKILEKNKKHEDVSALLFQLLGNCYDMLGETEKAFEAYDAGLKLFPKSGAIYLEKGNVYWIQKDYNAAITYYEKGIEVDPNFPSNYYRAALIYLNSNEEVWGQIYGEIFMNIEPNSARTAEISKLLYDTYKSEIQFTSDSSISVSFCQQMTMNINDISDDKEIKLPFCLIYEPTFLMAIALEKSIDINSLARIREGFVENYFNMEHHKTHPNVLFDFQKRIIDEGHFDAYSHWILMKGDPGGFNTWFESNEGN